jgi:hypothetical protein
MLVTCERGWLGTDESTVLGLTETILVALLCPEQFEPVQLASSYFAMGSTGIGKPICCVGTRTQVRGRKAEARGS